MGEGGSKFPEKGLRSLWMAPYLTKIFSKFGAVHKLHRHLGGREGQLIVYLGGGYLEGFYCKKAKIVYVVGEGGSKFLKKCLRSLWMATREHKGTSNKWRNATRGRPQTK